jgi:hypothetical protein
MTDINWKAPAKVTLFTRQSEYERGKTLYEGDLAGAVQAVMNLPEEKRVGARIFTDRATAHTEHGFFGRSDTEELAARADFPLSSPGT